MVKTDQQTTEKWLAWTANLPATWSVRQLKYLAAVISSNVDKKTVEGEEPVRLCNYVDVYHNDRITSDLDFMNASATAVEIEKFTLRKDDVIITKDSESADDIAVPAHVVDDLDGVLCGYHLAVIRPRSHNLCGRFLFYCFAADIINHQFAVSAKGITRFGLSLGALGNALFPLPSLHDQHIIADFLDEKTAAIDALIAKKERLIELIEEKRQATITHAVTKGLDPDVPMKDSGVEWLGEVPAHWRTMPLKRGARRIQTGSTPPTADERYYESGTIPWYGPSSFGGSLDLGEPVKLITEYAIQAGVARLFLGGSVLMVTIGATLGKVGLLTESGSTNQQITAIEPTSSVLNSEFLANQMKCMEHVMRAIAPNTTLPILNQQEVGSLQVVVPPINEQEEIAAKCHEIWEATKAIVEAQRSSAKKLREYRQTLISAAVTGQLDVRSRTARALDPTVPEPLEEVLT